MQKRELPRQAEGVGRRPSRRSQRTNLRNKKKQPSPREEHKFGNSLLTAAATQRMRPIPITQNQQEHAPPPGTAATSTFLTKKRVFRHQDSTTTIPGPDRTGPGLDQDRASTGPGLCQDAPGPHQAREQTWLSPQGEPRFRRGLRKLKTLLRKNVTATAATGKVAREV